MSSQVLLCTTNLGSPLESFEDDWNDGDNQTLIVEAPNRLPALLWLPMFNGIPWLNVVDTEQYEQAMEEGKEADESDYSFGVPFAEKELAIRNLLDSEPYLSQYFEENGGVKHLIDNLISILENTDGKYVFINTEGSSFNSLEPKDKDIINSLERICNGDMNISKNDISYHFGLVLEDNGPVRFLSASELYIESYKYDQILEPNLIFLTGISQEYANKL